MKRLAVIAILALPSLAHGQLAPAASSPFGVVHGAFFALSVADLDASTKWYSEKFGLKVDLRSPDPGGAVVVVLSANGLTVELIHVPKATPLGKDAQLAHGIVKVGIVVDDLEKVAAALTARGITVTGPWPAKPEQHMLANFMISDNAGNIIQFFGR